MVQAGNANTIREVLRSVSVTLFDKPAYWLLGIMYQIFFNVATADLFNSAIILNFYKRVQLIIGVFMIFQLAIIILKGIMNPDQVTDSKSGVGVFIKKVIIALVLLTVLTPISIPSPANEYQRQINNNGLLFGTLYSLQYRILSNNTLGRLILGTDTKGITTDDATADDDLSETDKQTLILQRSSNIFAATIVKGFVRINLKPDWVQPEDGSDPETKNSNRMCTDISDRDLEAYTKLDADPSEILDLVTVTCVPEDDQKWYEIGIVGEISGELQGKKRWAFAYTPLLGAITGFGFAFILISYTVSIALRAIKLVVLRLIAPIPIIGYMDPKGGKDSAFNAWVKMTTSTYLDLFIRLAIIYFIIFLIQDMIINGIGFSQTGNPIIKVISFIFICVGLFAFGKEAPKFIREAIGLKGDGPGLFTGFGQLMGAKSALAAVTSGARTGFAASRLSDQENGKGGLLHSMKNVGAGIAGAISGGKAGIQGAYSAKSAKEMSAAAQAASNKRNFEMFNNALEGGTFGGRLKSKMSANWLGDTDAMKKDRRMAKDKKVLDLIKAIEQEFDDDEDVRKETRELEWLKNNGGTTAQIAAQEGRLKQAKANAFRNHSETDSQDRINEMANNLIELTKYDENLPSSGLTNYDQLKNLKGAASAETFKYQSGSGMTGYRANKANDASNGFGKQK